MAAENFIDCAKELRLFGKWWMKIGRSKDKIYAMSMSSAKRNGVQRHAEMKTSLPYIRDNTVPRTPLLIIPLILVCENGR